MRFKKEHEGKCVAVVKGKVVLESRSIAKVIKESIKNYSPDEVTIASVPKGKKILVL